MMNDRAIESDSAEPRQEKDLVQKPRLNPPAPEYRIYRVTRASLKGPQCPLTLRLPDAERLTRDQEAKVEAAGATVEGRVYFFETVGVSHQVPLTEEQATDLRRNGWTLSEGRLPRSKGERAVVDQLICRSQEAAARFEEARARRVRQEVAVYRHEWRITTGTLYLPRVLRKIPRVWTPRKWLDVAQAYEQRRCDYEGRRYGQQSRPVRKAPWPELDLREIRRIVFGWEEHPEAEIFDYEDQFHPEGRDRLEKALATFPDCPIGIVSLLEEFQPVAEQLRSLKEVLSREPIHWLLDEDQDKTLGEVCRRGDALTVALVEARESLREMGWEISDEGRLRSIPGAKGGRAGEYVNRVIRELYLYLRPIYQAAFDDPKANPDPLREQVCTLLSPYFDPAGLDTGRKGQIWNQFVSAAYRSK